MRRVRPKCVEADGAQKCRIMKATVLVRLCDGLIKRYSTYPAPCALCKKSKHRIWDPEEVMPRSDSPTNKQRRRALIP